MNKQKSIKTNHGKNAVNVILDRIKNTPVGRSGATLVFKGVDGELKHIATHKSK